MKQWYRKTGNALLSVVILGFAMTIALTACKSEDDGYTDELSEVNLQRWSRNEHLVALAVCRVYDGKAMTLKSSGGSLEDSSTSPLINPKSDVEYPSIKYEFDFIKIGDAVHYLARGVNFPFLNEICGKGEIEVFMTYFNTYKYADEKKDNNAAGKKTKINASKNK